MGWAHTADILKEFNKKTFVTVRNFVNYFIILTSLQE
jgi:hypothetical protein